MATLTDTQKLRRRAITMYMLDKPNRPVCAAELKAEIGKYCGCYPSRATVRNDMLQLSEDRPQQFRYHGGNLVHTV